MRANKYRLLELSLHDFKCFNHIDVPLSELTLFTGYNAAGKSSCIQGILFLAQYFRSSYLSNLANLNGPLTKLGSFGELINNKSNNDKIIIDTTLCERESGSKPQARYRFEFVSNKDGYDNVLTADVVNEYDVESNLNAIKSRIKINSENRLLGDVLPDLVELIRETIYISSEREALKDIFPVVTLGNSIHADVGVDGRFASWWFHEYSDEEIDIERLHPNESSNTLRRQLNAWASNIFPGVQANTQRVEKTNYVKLELRMSEFQDWKRPSNVGYGIYYVFPILIAGLLGKRNQLLIIESPEAHLHPAGQSKLGQFLATMANAGLQVIVETHSDHFLNGVRLAVKNNIISNDHVQIHFFENKNTEDEYISHITAININTKGILSGWPEGFFDQSDKDLSELV